MITAIISNKVLSAVTKTVITAAVNMARYSNGKWNILANILSGILNLSSF